MQAGNCQAIFKNKKEFFKKRATAFESAENERRAGKTPKKRDGEHRPNDQENRV
jgi:hypothetical protein